MADWSISETDVKQHPKYNTWDLEKILYAYGMDISKGYTTDGRDTQEAPEDIEIEHHGYTHRSVFTGEISSGIRYIGVAREDSGWKSFVHKLLSTHSI